MSYTCQHIQWCLCVRVLFVSTIPQTLRLFYLPFASYFRSKGWQVDAMARDISLDPKCVEAFDRVWDIDWSRSPLPLNNILVAPNQVLEVIRNGQYDLVQTATPVAGFITRVTLSRIHCDNRPIVIHTVFGFHFYPGGNAIKNLIFSSLERIAGKFTDYLVVSTFEDGEAVRRLQIVPDDRLHHIPSGIGVDLDRYNPKSVADSEVSQIYQELRICSNTPLFLYVAEFIPRKRPQDVIRAFHRLGCTNAHLAMLGEGRWLSRMKDLARSLQIDDRIHFLGFRRDLPCLLKAATATVSASDREGIPLNLISSICMETPIVATNIRGTRELLEMGAGISVNVANPDSLAQGMKWVIDNPNEAKMMGIKGRKKMIVFDQREIIRLYEDLYIKVVSL